MRDWRSHHALQLEPHGRESANRGILKGMSALRLRETTLGIVSAAFILATAVLVGGCHKPKMHQYAPIDLAYFDTAPTLLDDKITIDRPVAEVWSVFEDNEAWQIFDIGIKKATWTSDTPLHAGSTRQVMFSKWMGGGHVDEVFFVWDIHEQFAFYMQQGTSSLVHSYGELWILTDLGNGTTEVEFRTAFTLKTTFDDFVASGMSRVLDLGYKHVLKNLKSYVEEGRVSAVPAPPSERRADDESPAVK